jgi:hypothetical protein
VPLIQTSPASSNEAAATFCAAAMRVSDFGGFGVLINQEAHQARGRRTRALGYAGSHDRLATQY